MELIEVGKIVNTHGIKGEVKILPWVDSLEEFEYFEDFYYLKDSEYIKLDATNIRFHKNCVIIKFKDFETINEAQGLKGVVIYSQKDQNLPNGVYYIKDLLGLKVVYGNNELGVVKDVIKTGANDVYEVKTKAGKSIFIPAIKDVVKNIDIDKNIIEIELIDGLLD